MKTMTALVVVLLSAVVFGASFPTGAQQGTPVELKAVYWPPQSDLSKDIFLMWVQRVNEAAKGRLAVKVLGGPEVVPIAGQVKAMVSGSVDIVSSYPANYAAEAPEAATLNASMINPVREREVGYYRILDQAHRRARIKFIGRNVTDWGFYIYSKVPIRKLSDLKGMKIRGHSGYKPFFDALGAETIPIGLSEVYTALERGLVQAAPAIPDVFSLGWHEVTKYVVDCPFWSANNSVTLMSLEKWERLSAAQQEVLEGEQIRLEQEMGRLSQSALAKEREKLKKAGMEFIPLSEDECRRYQQLAATEGFYFGGKKDIMPPEVAGKIQGLIWPPEMMRK